MVSCDSACGQKLSWYDGVVVLSLDVGDFVAGVSHMMARLYNGGYCSLSLVERQGNVGGTLAARLAKVEAVADVGPESVGQSSVMFSLSRLGLNLRRALDDVEAAGHRLREHPLDVVVTADKVEYVRPVDVETDGDSIRSG